MRRITLLTTVLALIAALVLGGAQPVCASLVFAQGAVGGSGIDLTDGTVRPVIRVKFE